MVFGGGALLNTGFPPEMGCLGVFYGIESMPHISSGTSIATQEGAIPAGWLRVGDLVVTRDLGLQPILAIGHIEMTCTMLKDRPGLWPVEIAPGALGQGKPTERLIVSPWQRIHVRKGQSPMGDEALVAARHLIGWPGIEAVMPAQAMSSYQILFKNHELILADGQWVESLCLSQSHLGQLCADDAHIFADFRGHRRLVRPELCPRDAAQLVPPADWTSAGRISA